MNIIEAMQAAENGKHITNSFLTQRGCFLKYMGNGVFFEYQAIINHYTIFTRVVQQFGTAHILSLSWQISNIPICMPPDDTYAVVT